MDNSLVKFLGVQIRGRRSIKKKILVVDYEVNVRQTLEKRLTTRGYYVVAALDGEEALSMFHKEKPDLVILDVMIPKISGYTVCNELRKRSNVPIIILTSRSNISDRVMGLEFGADDYVIKPFSPKELEARIRSLLRRSEKITLTTPSNTCLFEIGSIHVNTQSRQVLKDNKLVRLTEMEFKLLELLISKAGERLSRAYILDNVWGYIPERYLDTRVIDVHISRLRLKLEKNPNQPDLILTARGTGYMFQKIATY
jgi:OmpR family response regulator RpaB